MALLREQVNDIYQKNLSRPATDFEFNQTSTMGIPQIQQNLNSYKTLNKDLSVVDYLKYSGQDSSPEARIKLAQGYGISDYNPSNPASNIQLLQNIKTPPKPQIIPPSGGSVQGASVNPPTLDERALNLLKFGASTDAVLNGNALNLPNPNAINGKIPGLRVMGSIPGATQSTPNQVAEKVTEPEKITQPEMSSADKKLLPLSSTQETFKAPEKSQIQIDAEKKTTEETPEVTLESALNDYRKAQAEVKRIDRLINDVYEQRRSQIARSGGIVDEALLESQVLAEQSPLIRQRQVLADKQAELGNIYKDLKTSQTEDRDYQMKVAEFKAKYGGTPKEIIEGVTETQITDVGDALNRIAGVESAGSGDYNAIGPVIPSGAYKGDKAYGKYQIMGQNIIDWSKEMGQPMTIEEFYNSPQLQDKLASFKLQQYYNKYGNWEDAASVWFTGRPYAQAVKEGAADLATGFTVQQYINKFKGSKELPTEILAGVSNVTSFLPDKKRQEVQKQITSDIQNGRYADVYTKLQKSVSDGLTGDNKTRFDDATAGVYGLDALEKAITKFKNAGGDTGLLTGKAEEIERKLLGVTDNPELTALAAELNSAFFEYRSQVTGAAFSPAETRAYQSILPSTGNDFDLNIAIIKGAKNAYKNKVESRMKSEMGEENYKQLQTKLNKSVSDPINVMETETINVNDPLGIL